MTTPNTIIADLAHEIDRLQKISGLLLSAAVNAEAFIASIKDDENQYIPALLGDLRYAIDEAMK